MPDASVGNSSRRRFKAVVDMLAAHFSTGRHDDGCDSGLNWLNLPVWSALFSFRLLSFFGRSLDQRRTGDHVAFLGLHQADPLSAAAGLANLPGFNANQLALLRDDHDL